MPLNLLGDYAGGSLYLLVGILAAIIQARASGVGQVVDASIVDGTANLMSLFYGLAATGQHNGPRGTNDLDGGKPWYRVYRCADGKYLSFAALEKKFRAIFCEAVGWPANALDVSGTEPEAAAGKRLEALFLEKGRDEWCRLLGSVDACVAPVLSTSEAPDHRWNAEREVFATVDGVVQPAAAPRFSATPAAPPAAVRPPGDGLEAALADWGVGRDRVEKLAGSGALVRKR